MAVSQTTDGEEVECPVCGEYEGVPRSVEAHISGLCDDAHEGEVGRHYRDELEGAAGVEDAAAATSESPSVDGLDEAAETTSEGGLDVEPATVALVGLVAFAVVVGWKMWGSDDGTSNEGEPDEEESADPVPSGVVA
jgi:hypothetical protein